MGQCKITAIVRIILQVTRMPVMMNAIQSFLSADIEHSEDCQFSVEDMLIYSSCVNCLFLIDKEYVLLKHEISL